MAFSEARRTIHALDAYEASMERNKGVNYFAQNPGQKLTARFLSGGVRIEAGGSGADWQAFFTTPELPFPSTMTTKGTRLEYRRGDVTEWYDNRPDGIEHGFIVAKPLSDDGDVRVKVRIDGLTAQQALNDETSIHLSDASGQPRLSYDKLLAWDADGVELRSRMEAGADGIELIVSASQARYPINIDPLISSLVQQLGPEISGDGGGINAFGHSVSISGNTALIGASLTETAAGVYSGNAYVFVRNGDVWTLQSLLSGNDTNSNDRFGNSVSLQGDTAVIGAYLDDPKGSNSGSAYIFTRSGNAWSQRAKLVPADGASNANFGNRVSVSGDYVLIGSNSASTPAGAYAGSAYVYFRSGSTWNLQAKLTASDGAPSDYFGTSVSIDGDTAAIGASRDDDFGDSSGSAYVFIRNGFTWTQQAKITPADASIGDSFGYSVSLHGNSLLVGSYLEDERGQDAGAAYVFTRSGETWLEEAKLSASDGTKNSYFGISASLEGDTALLGAFWENSQTGSAYVFTRSGTTWTQQSKLTANDKIGGSYFGVSVSLSGATALVGAADDAALTGTKSGSSYVFNRNGSTWSQTAKLPDFGDSAAEDRFGTSISLDGDTAAIGASDDDTAAGSQSGTCYVFNRAANQWTFESKIAAADARAEDRFGNSVSVDGDTLIVGALFADVNPGVNYSTGSAYVFVRNGSSWTQQAKLIQNDVDSLDFFGCAVSLDGDSALVGSYWDLDRRGSAYIFVRSGNTWSQQAKLTDPNGSSEDNLGASVSLRGNTAMIGAATDDDLGNQSGAVFVFSRVGSTWRQQAKLTASDGSSFNYFGSSISLDGDTAIIGADGGLSRLTGSAYIFTQSAGVWTESAKLTAPDKAESSMFGSSVSIEGNRAVIGAERDDVGGVTDAGSIYIFERNGTVWKEQLKIANPSIGFLDYFGAGVALSGDTVLIGTPGDDGFGLSGLPSSNQGRVYVYRVEELVPPVVLWDSLTSITETSAAFAATATGSAILSRGFVYSNTSINADPVIGGPGVKRVDVSGTTGVFRTTATSLFGFTNYTVRAFAINAAGTTYSQPVVNFRTLSSDLSVSMSGVPSPVPAGMNVIYAIHVRNGGPSTVSGVSVSSVLPPEMIFVSAATPIGWKTTTPQPGSGGTLSFVAPGSLAQGASQTITIVAQIKSNIPNGTLIKNRVEAKGNGTDSDATNNVAVTLTPVGTAEPTTLQIGNTTTFSRQNGLFELSVEVTNTTPYPINGFRLHVDYDAYKTAYPSLRLYNATSPVGESDVFVDHPYPVPVDGVVALKLSFYTSTRTFPSPFSPVFTVETLASSQIPGTDGSGVQPILKSLPDRTILLEFPSVPGRWYRVRYCSDSKTWSESPVPIQASTDRMQWIDSGPPFTDTAPSEAKSRYYRVNEITAP